MLLPGTGVGVEQEEAASNLQPGPRDSSFYLMPISLVAREPSSRPSMLDTVISQRLNGWWTNRYLQLARGERFGPSLHIFHADALIIPSDKSP